jgi:transcriptional regulator with XRE-family HTH domain
MKDRLLQLLNKLGLSATKFADELNVQRSGISHILSGRNQPSYDFLVKILTRFPQIDSEWLILGKNSMFKLQPENNNLIRSDPPAAYSAPAQKAGDLFSQPLDTNVNISSSHLQQNNITNVTSVTRIILLHSDDTFSIYDQPIKE